MLNTWHAKSIGLAGYIIYAILMNPRDQMSKFLDHLVSISSAGNDFSLQNDKTRPHVEAGAQKCIVLGPTGWLQIFDTNLNINVIKV